MDLRQMAGKKKWRFGHAGSAWLRKGLVWSHSWWNYRQIRNHYSTITITFTLTLTLTLTLTSTSTSTITITSIILPEELLHSRGGLVGAPRCKDLLEHPAPVVSYRVYGPHYYIISYYVIRLVYYYIFSYMIIGLSAADLMI